VSIKNCCPLPKEATSTRLTHARLPVDLIEKAVGRLGMLGLLSAIADALLHYGTLAFLPANIRQAIPAPPSSLAMWFAIVSGLAIFGLARSRKVNSELMLDLGLLFEVVGAFCIGMMEASRFLADKPVYLGPGAVSLWITFFVLVVPNTLGKTALAALASAFMGPVAVVAAAYTNGQPPPAPFLLLLAFFPNLLGAVLAIILSRFVYSLGTDVSKAREMGSYKLVELLGRGGMGEVWRAEHRLLVRPAAVKLIQPEVLGFHDSRQTEVIKRRFEREAQATAMLSSPHTIHLYDFGMTEDGAFYYVMELLHGIDLETLVEKYGPLPAERAAHFLLQICSSLEEAHQDGLIHRDVKPANIYISRYGVEYDFVKVLDFGIVKSKSDTTTQTLTSANDANGTPGFMAPEMALGKVIDARVDIYAVGCVAYWLLTGRLVFEEETSLATILAHAQKTPVAPSRRSEIEIPPSFEKLIMSCLEKDPQRRPSSAREIIRTLSQYGVANAWTPERAEKWWQTHMPEKSGPAPQRPLQTDVQTNVATN
jgi:eukaryotic-like serine/threonine-protein kinase